MENNLFRQATALMVGSLVTFSGQAMAMELREQKPSNAEVLGDSELLIAQADTVGTQDRIALANAVVLARICIAEAAAVTQATSLPTQKKLVVANSVAQANTVLGNALAQTQSTTLTKTSAATIVNSLSEVKSIVDSLEAVAGIRVNCYWQDDLESIAK